jgi:hypothetical protein
MMALAYNTGPFQALCPPTHDDPRLTCPTVERLEHMKNIEDGSYDVFDTAGASSRGAAEDLARGGNDLSMGATGRRRARVTPSTLLLPNIGG